MRTELIPMSGSFYKANLHCHSTISDGKLSPAELKEIYMQQGYSVLAYTDHNILVGHNDLTDNSFLALNGCELEISEGNDADDKTCHICYIALDPENLTQVCYHRTKYLYGNAENYRDQITINPSQKDFERIYSPEGISEMMKEGRDNGFFVTYNHPAWSMETWQEYSRYHHMHAMEICNYGCLAYGWPDYNEKEYDELLRCGKRIYCIAADDNHNWHPTGSGHWDSFGGFTMIKADTLTYRAITDALLAGHFYASQGPTIEALWFEDGRIHITCSSARSIVLNTGTRRAKAVYAEAGMPLTYACFDVKETDKYVRLTVTDEAGRHANTNAYFVDELMGE